MDVQPYLIFQGRCEEALEFYRKALGAEITFLLRRSDTPPTAGPMPFPAGSGDKIAHAELRIGGTTVMATDGMGDAPTEYRGFALTVSVADVPEAEKRFAALAEGGVVREKLGPTFFSQAWGVLADRFGIEWMVVAPPPA